MSVAQTELIELYKKDDKASLDSNGQRLLTADDAFNLACRLLDIGMQVEGIVPLQPFDDQLIVRVIHETGRKSAGGMDLLDTDNEFVMAGQPALRGVILAVGPKVEKMAELFTVVPKVGDLIAFTKNAGMETVIGEKRYCAMKVNYAIYKYLIPHAATDGD